MIEDWTSIEVTPGSLCSERLPAPLDPSALRVRPATVAENFCTAGRQMGAEGANLLRDADRSPWARLFLAEPAYLLSEILSFHAEDSARAFHIALESDPAAAMAQISSLSRILGDWIARLKAQLPGRFSKQLKQLNIEGALEDRIAGLSQPQMPAILAAVKGGGLVPRAIRPRDPLAEARAQMTGLRATHALLRNSVVTLQPVAATVFDERLASGEIDPALGLLLAELQTAALVDAQINEIVERHLRFYYGDIIGQFPAPATVEKVLLQLPPSAKPVFLPEGTSLQARLADNSVQSFVTEVPVHVSPARVASTAVLIYDTDPRISFNAALAGITGVRAARHPPGPREGRDGVFATSSRTAVDLGLDIASPMLALAEGDRLIELRLRMRRASNLPAGSRPLSEDELLRRARLGGRDPEVVLALRTDPDLVRAFGWPEPEAGIQIIAERVEEMVRARRVSPSLALIYEALAVFVLDIDALRVLLGRIVTLGLIEGEPLPQGDYWLMLRSKIDACREQLTGQTLANGLSADAQASMIFEAFARNDDGSFVYSTQDMFQKLLGDAFSLRLSTPEGPRAPSWAQVLPSPRPGEAGLVLRLMVDASLPPIAAPDPGAAPVLSLRYAPDARICPVSFFERYTIRSVGFRVKAAGLRALKAFSDDGPLATDQTFLPFGPRPGDGATFIVGCREMAQKPVREVGIALTWAEMPDPVGGFAAHYADYKTAGEVPDPVLALDYLSADGWRPITEEPVPMFARRPVTGALMPARALAGPVLGNSIPAAAPVTAQEFKSRQTIRAGALRLTLGGTAGGFHADQYPLALVDAMRPRLLPFARRRIPPEPFVPRIADLALSYAAEAEIELGMPDAARPGERIVQVGPFGQVEVFPSRMQREIGLFPARLGYGHLFIEIDGPGATGPLVLIFDTAESGHLRRIPEPNPIEWHYLTATGWTALPATALSSDSTAGLMRSGLLMIDLPEDAVRRSPEMPGSGVWLAAVATRPRLHGFPTLRGVETNGLLAARADESFGAEGAARVWTFAPPKPALGKLAELRSPAATHPPETQAAYVARVGERLRHRKRAVTPWDIERMVLQEFPEVWMVKCLPHLVRTGPQPEPGHCTVVAVRHPPEISARVAPAPHLFDASTLKRIDDFITATGPGFARFDVVNPGFERLQVRAKLEFDHYRDDGAMAQRLKTDLRRYLSVWTGPPELARFGWALNVKMLRAHISSLEYVRGVTDFSVLHLAADDGGTYRLLDTAQSDGRGPHGPRIHGIHPWSLPLSAPDHALTILSETQAEDPIQSGIGRLCVGDMLIVGQRTQP